MALSLFQLMTCGDRLDPVPRMRWGWLLASPDLCDHTLGPAPECFRGERPLLGVFSVPSCLSRPVR